MLDEWDVYDVWTLMLIIYNCKNLVRLSIIIDDSAVQACDSLIKAYNVILDLAAIEADNTLYRTRFADKEDLLAYLLNMHIK